MDLLIRAQIKTRLVAISFSTRVTFIIKKKASKRKKLEISTIGL